MLCTCAVNGLQLIGVAFNLFKHRFELCAGGREVGGLEVFSPERVPGVAQTIVFGERASEVRITFDPYKAAALGIDIPTLAAITGNNTDTTGGFSDVGRRQYTVRFAGRYEIEDFGDMVLTWRDGNPVRLRDLATVERRLVDQTELLIESGGPSLAIGVIPEEGINVLEVMEELKVAMAELQAGPLAREGPSGNGTASS